MNYWKAFFCTVLYMGLFVPVLWAAGADAGSPWVGVFGCAMYVGFLCFFVKPKEDRE